MINKTRKLIKTIFFLLTNIIPISLILFVAITTAMIYEVYNRQDKKYTERIQIVSTKKIPEHILKYIPIIEKYLEYFKVDKKYLPYILAQITQESYGKEPDVFQASESKYNGKIGMIKTVDESIEQGIKRWSEIIRQIEEQQIEFSIPLVLQTYNFGSGYLQWVKTHGNKYTKENAKSFSNHMLQILDHWSYSIYGDINYVSNVFRYLDFTDNLNIAEYNFIPENFEFPIPDPNHRAKINGGEYGHCTWYVYNRLSQLGKPIPYWKMGHGGEWWQYAISYGYPVSREAKAGRAISFPPVGKDPWGHIAFVEKVFPNGSVYISEMNIVGLEILSFRTLTKEEASRCYFIDFGL